MKLKPNLIGLIFLCIYFSCTPPLSLRQPLADLPRLLRENDQNSTLNVYKDSEAILRLKLEHLVDINRSRLGAGQQPVRLDLLASRVANKHCVEMAQNKFISHWNTRGEKPYHRYAAAGGTHAVMENLFRLHTTGLLREAEIHNYLNQGHTGFMAEKPPDDGHRVNILDPHHNAVGLGFHLEAQEFAYAQEFLNEYLQLDDFPRQIRSDETIRFSGKMLQNKMHPFLLVAFYEPHPTPMSVKALEQTAIYSDFTDTQFLTLWNQFSFDEKTGDFSIEMPFENAKPGWFYIKILVTLKPGKIHQSKDGFAATSVVVEVM
jgi:hypothetical protein